jgi:hypothetical protein
MKWFGEPWPSAEERAPICDDDKDQDRTPVGSLCIGCGEPIEADDRGVLMPYAGRPDKYTMFRRAHPALDVGWLPYVAEHIDCLIRSVAPGMEAFIERKPGAVRVSS